jgi:sec-independent protein translocase protein TatA
MVLAAGPFGLGPMELIVILLVLVMLFGATRIADLGGSLGKGIREFRKSVADDGDQDSEESSPADGASHGSNPASQTVQATKCPSCGSPNPMTAKHCNQCGTAVAGTAP